MKLNATNHFGNNFCLPMMIMNAYVIHIIRLITMAENPSVMMVFLKKGILSATSFPKGAEVLVSNLFRMAKMMNAILQMTVNFEKKEIIFI